MVANLLVLAAGLHHLSSGQQVGWNRHARCQAAIRGLRCAAASQVTINNPLAAPDTAGLVIDSSTDVFVHDLTVSTGAHPNSSLQSGTLDRHA